MRLRHLKDWKLFESKNGYIEDISDIFLELQDDGYNIKTFKPEVRNKPKSYLESIQVEINKDRFRISDISSELIRLDDYVGDSYKIIIKYVESKFWLIGSLTIDELDKVKDKEFSKVFISLYNTNDAYHAIWINKDDPRVWDVLKPDFTTREEAIEYIKRTHIGSDHVTKSFISDNEYWLKLKYLK